MHITTIIPFLIVMIIGLLISFGVYLFLVYPRISVYPGKTVDPYNPFRTPFLVENVGYMPVFDVSYSMIIARVGGVSPDAYMNAPMSITNTIPRLHSHERLAIFDKNPIVIDGPAEHMKYAEIYIRVSYRSYLLPVTFVKGLRFYSMATIIGDFNWFEDKRRRKYSLSLHETRLIFTSEEPK